MLHVLLFTVAAPIVALPLAEGAAPPTGSVSGTPAEATSRSPTAAELLVRGEQSLADLEYEQAAEELMRAATAPDATDEQRLRAHLLAGTANRIAGKDVDAQINFRYVLARAPDTQMPPGTPPKVLTFFEAVRQDLAAEQANAAKEAAAQGPAAAPAPAPAFPLGLAVAGAGGAVALIGGLGLGGAEVFLMDPKAAGDTRATVQTLGVVSTGVLVIGVVVAGAGLALWATGAVP